MKSTSKRLIFWTLLLAFFIYTIVVYTNGTAIDRGEALLSKQSKNGKLLFQEYNCTACHQIYGLGGYMGPDLTNVISATNKGPIYTKAFIQNGTARMPNFHLSENEVDDLVTYLIYIDKTGVSPVKRFTTTYYGTITQDQKNEKRD